MVIWKAVQLTFPPLLIVKTFFDMVSGDSVQFRFVSAVLLAMLRQWLPPRLIEAISAKGDFDREDGT